MDLPLKIFLATHDFRRVNCCYFIFLIEGEGDGMYESSFGIVKFKRPHPLLVQQCDIFNNVKMLKTLLFLISLES